MTTLFLVRHGAHGRLNRHLDGRREGVHLSDDGHAQAQRLAVRLAREKVAAVFSSPLVRAQETAAPVAQALGLAVTVDQALEEVDFGDWSGRTFDELAPLDEWRRWNSARSTARTPAGDTMRASQARMLDFIDARRLAQPDAPILLVSHADPIKAVLVYYLGLSLNDLPRFEIAPASLSRVDIEPWGARVVVLNETVPA